MNQILEILGSVGFNWHVALANFVNFLIILFILNRFFFRKLGKTISDRQEAIERGLSQAADAERTLVEAERKKAELVRDAKKEGHAIIEEAHIQAKELAASIKEGAEAEMAAKIQALAEKEAHLRSKVEKEIADAAPILVAKLYAETLRKNLSEKDNNELVASMKS